MKRRTGINSIAYMGVEPLTPPEFTTQNRAPTVNDYLNWNTGTFWLRMPAEDLWLLVSKDGRQGNWVQLDTSGSVGIQTLTGDIGGAVPPDGSGNIDTLGAGILVVTGNPGTNTLSFGFLGGNNPTIEYTADVGTASADAVGNTNVFGGSHINTVGDGVTTLTINLDTDIADTYTTDAGNAIPVGGVLNILGGTSASTTGAGNTVTINVDGDVASSYVTDLGTATPAGNILNVLGGTNMNTDGAGNTININTDNPGFGVIQSDAAGLFTASDGNDGQVLISSSTPGTSPAWANVTSSDASITITNGSNSLDIKTTAGGGYPAQIASFMAYQPINDNRGGPGYDSTRPYNAGNYSAYTEMFDQGNNFFPGDGLGTGNVAVFTAPVDGYYEFTFQGSFYQSPAIIRLGTEIQIITTNRTYIRGMRINSSTATGTFSAASTIMTTIADMNAGHTAIFDILNVISSGSMNSYGSSTLLATFITGKLILPV